MDDLWQRVENVFHAMLEQPPERRPKFLDDACAGDTELRREVESLLRASREGESLMEWPAAAQLGLATAPGAATPSWGPRAP